MAAFYTLHRILIDELPGWLRAGWGCSLWSFSVGDGVMLCGWTGQPGSRGKYSSNVTGSGSGIKVKLCW